MKPVTMPTKVAERFMRGFTSGKIPEDILLRIEHTDQFRLVAYWNYSDKVVGYLVEDSGAHNAPQQLTLLLADGGICTHLPINVDSDAPPPIMLKEEAQ